MNKTGLYTYHPTTPPTQNATSYRGSKEDHAKTGLYASGEPRRMHCIFSRRDNPYRNLPTHDNRAVSHHVTQLLQTSSSLRQV